MKNLTPSPNYMTSGMFEVGGGKLPHPPPPQINVHTGLERVPLVLEHYWGMMLVIWGPPAPVPTWRGQSGSRACPRRLAWQQRAPRPYFTAFCSRPPTWAWGQAPRQGSILGNNASVFLLVEGRSAEDEVGQTASRAGGSNPGRASLLVILQELQRPGVSQRP